MNRHIPWIILAIVGAVCLAVLAVSRGEAANALWIVVAAVSCFLVAYRYYALYIARHVMRLDPSRATPALTRADGLDYVATDRRVLFGHHFAAIAGAGPLVGPVLAPAKSMAQMQAIVFNDRVDAGLCVIFLAVVISLMGFTVRTCIAALREDRPTVNESPVQMVPAE